MKKTLVIIVLAALAAGCGPGGAKAVDGKSPVRDSAALKNTGADSTKSVKSNNGNADPSGRIKNK